ncbi:hypothetical protein INH39_27890 [Massilia violaceinigra]|uniref:Uncharacterized protein n=1 Tax=Massilia violaceinigra TaxID=2045208 RepID=A0ABY4A9C9_9BURK|nr:hypothetical protein INH39_27890 [Massilia violaceinigra]
MSGRVGSGSLADDPAKLAHAGLEIFRMDGRALPFVAGCSAWLACTLIYAIGEAVVARGQE